MSYRYLVEDNTRGLHRTRYDGTVAADAMGAAWWACRRSHITRAVIAAIERGN